MSADAGLGGVPGAGAPAYAPAAGPSQAPAEPGSSAAPALAAPPPDKYRHWAVAAAARGLALFIGGFTLVGVYASWRHETLDFNIWWVALPFGGWIVHAGLLALAGVALVAYAVAPRMRPWRRWTTLAVCLLLAAVTAWNGVDFYLAWRAGELRPGLPVPLSFVICALLVFIAWAALRPPAPKRRRLAAAAVLVATAAACVLALPARAGLLLREDRLPAPGRRSSSSSAPRSTRTAAPPRRSAIAWTRRSASTRTAWSRSVLVSGGVGDSGFNEALVMRDMAVEAGVPQEGRDRRLRGREHRGDRARTRVPFFGGGRSVPCAGREPVLPPAAHQARLPASRRTCSRCPPARRHRSRRRRASWSARSPRSGSTTCEAVFR